MLFSVERRDPLNYIIFDLEWNQPSSWECAVVDPIYLEGEIIEIGALKLNDDFQPVDEFKIYVLPQFYQKMHHAVASLTRIHDKLLAEKGIPFSEAFRRFMDWCGEECTFMTWSMSDLPVLIDNMIIHGLDLSQLPPCCDIQRIFGREIMRTQTRYSLNGALEILQEKPDMAHDALNDARNTVKVCNHLDLEQYVDEYISCVFPQASDGMVYETKQQILTSEELLTFECPYCGERVRCEAWIPSGRNSYLAYGICTEEDEFILELSIQHRGDETFTAKRIVFELSDDLWDIYMDRKELLGV